MTADSPESAATGSPDTTTLPVRLPDPAHVFDYPEVILPWYRAPQRVSTSPKARFWGSLSTWTSGYLTNHTNKPYRNEGCIAEYVTRTTRPIHNLQKPFEPWLLRNHNTVEKSVLEARVDNITTRRAMVYAVRSATGAEVNEAMHLARERMEHRMAQFFLRNIGRSIMEPAEELPFVRRPTQAGGLDDSALKEVRALATERVFPELDHISSVTFLRTVMAPLRFLLFKDPWKRFAGHELKTTIKGPLWQYFPDEAALKLYGGKNAQVLQTDDMSDE